MVDSFSTVDVVQYSGRISSVYAGDNINTVGIKTVVWRVFSTVEGSFSIVGDNSSRCGG